MSFIWHNASPKHVTRPCLEDLITVGVRSKLVSFRSVRYRARGMADPGVIHPVREVTYLFHLTRTNFHKPSLILTFFRDFTTYIYTGRVFDRKRQNSQARSHGCYAVISQTISHSEGCMDMESIPNEIRRKLTGRCKELHYLAWA